MPSPPPTGDPLPRWLAIGDDPGLVLAALALTVSTESQPHHLSYLGTEAACATAQQRAEALGVADRLTVGPVPSAVGVVAADHDMFVQLSRTSAVDQARDALRAGLPALLVRVPQVERALTLAVDLSVAEFVTPGDAAAAAAGYARLLVRRPDADWTTLRALLDRSSASERGAGITAAVIAVDDLGADALIPVLDALAACGVSTQVRTLVPGAAARLAAPVPGVRTASGPELPPTLQRIATAVPAKRDTGAARGARDVLSTLPSAAVGQLARLWVTRRPRKIASYVQALVEDTAPDLLVVDEYVSASLTAIKPSLPFTASVTQRARLWRHLADLLAPATAR